jgi:hypothetical protein
VVLFKARTLKNTGSDNFLNSDPLNKSISTEYLPGLTKVPSEIPAKGL